MGFAQLFGGGRREAFQEQRLDLVLPKNIDEFLVREQRVSETGRGRTENDASQQEHPCPLGERQPPCLEAGANRLCAAAAWFFTLVHARTLT